VADEALRIAAWRRLEGLPAGFELGVHPADEMLPGVAEPTSVPPGRERLVYLRTGLETLVVLEHALAAFGRSLAAPARVLEVACGYGRVTRHLLQRVEARRLVACEIVPAAVAHVATTFGIECLHSEADPARIRWPGRFDLIVVSSLFSHLPRHRFEHWLAALRGALADDGLALLSTHGPWMPQAPPDDGRGFAFHPDSESLTLDGAEYGTTFVAPGEVARMARAAGYADVRWLERELWALQDVFVIGAAPLREARPWRPAPVLDGGIAGSDFGGAPSDAAGAGTRQLWLHGWVECRDPEQAVERATLQLDATPAARLALIAPRREQAPPPRPASRFVAEWRVHEALPADLNGRRTLTLVAEAAGQRRVVDVRTLDLERLRLEG